MDYYDVFISCLVSLSDGTHSLQKITWRAIDAMKIVSKSFSIKKQTNLQLGWPEDKYILGYFKFWGEHFLYKYQKAKLPVDGCIYSKR